MLLPHNLSLCGKKWENYHVNLHQPTATQYRKIIYEYRKRLKINQNCVIWQKFAIVWRKISKNRGKSHVLRAPREMLQIFESAHEAQENLTFISLKCHQRAKQMAAAIWANAYFWKYLGRTCVSASCLATPMAKYTCVILQKLHGVFRQVCHLDLSGALWHHKILNLNRFRLNHIYSRAENTRVNERTCQMPPW